MAKKSLRDRFLVDTMLFSDIIVHLYSHTRYILLHTGRSYHKVSVSCDLIIALKALRTLSHKLALLAELCIQYCRSGA